MLRPIEVRRKHWVRIGPSPTNPDTCVHAQSAKTCFRRLGAQGCVGICRSCTYYSTERPPHLGACVYCAWVTVVAHRPCSLCRSQRRSGKSAGVGALRSVRRRQSGRWSLHSYSCVNRPWLCCCVTCSHPVSRRLWQARACLQAATDYCWHCRCWLQDQEEGLG